VSDEIKSDETGPEQEEREEIPEGKKEPETPGEAPSTESSEPEKEEPKTDSEAEAGEKPAEEKEKVPYELLEAKDEPGSIRQYKVKVPWEEYAKRQEKMLKDLQKKVILDGFRKGKAPIRLIQIRFRKELKEDLLNEITPLITDELLEKEGYSKLADPVVKESVIEPDNPLEIVITVEVLPKLEPGREDYTGMEITVKKQKITDELIESQLDEIRKRNAVFEPKEEGVLEEQDGIVVNVEVEDERGLELKDFNRHEFLLENPKEFFPEEVLRELLGKEKGAAVEVAVPAERKNPRGEVISKKDNWKVEILEMKKYILPELDDEFAKDLGGEFETLEDLKKRIKADLESHIEQHAQEDALDSIIQGILDKIPFDPPSSLVDYEKRGIVGEELQRLQNMGISLEQIKIDREEYLASRERQAIRQLKATFLLRAISESEKLEVSDKDFEDAIAKVAEAEGRKPLAIRAKLEAEGQLEGFRQNLMKDKVSNFLLENNNITYEEVDRKKEEESPEKES